MNTPAHVPTRADGARARERLLEAALRLFAEKGFDKTSTREIAEAAGVNLAAINYYFGDKGSLYQAVFSLFCEAGAAGPDGAPLQECTGHVPPDMALDSVLTQFYANFLAPLKQGERARLLMRLHFREIVEPSGELQRHVEQDFKPVHQFLAGLLAQRLAAAPDDLDIQRLALAIHGLGVFQFVAQDVMDALAPSLLADADAIDTLAQRLGTYAMGMVEAEIRRRELAPQPLPDSGDRS